MAMKITFTDIDVSDREQLLEVYTVLSPYFEKYNITSERSQGRKIHTAITGKSTFYVYKAKGEMFAVVREDYNTVLATSVFTILRGSYIVPDKPNMSLTPTVKEIREKAFKEGIIRDNVVLQDLSPCSSISTALSVIKAFNASPNATVDTVTDSVRQDAILKELERRVDYL